ncbi:hypothetical protein DPMN_048969 [Dreissena polymorpha]|uniref:Uncharacterized protein n=1 Tax=Dreissena polymorpha TaxID=45954 RepID=A0A9D4DBP4_DREPO|nr:hypothetical protein DPMN_048969 [Dreissena polymorpha]
MKVCLTTWLCHLPPQDYSLPTNMALFPPIQSRLFVYKPCYVPSLSTMTVCLPTWLYPLPPQTDCVST